MALSQNQITRLETAAAKQEIVELRSLYARATDLLGTGDTSALAEGRAIYHRIFTTDAVIAATGVDTVKGPDAWVEVVVDALADYQDTQHLIGSNLVTIDALPGAGKPGAAHMMSYLQAWHAKANDDLWLFIGTYDDELVHSEAHGWQIAKMTLSQVSGENRKLGTDA